jgi:hypothetical protein
MHETTIILPEEEKLLHWQFYHSLIVMVGISLIKISIACFLLRLVTITNKVYRIFLYCMIGKFCPFSIRQAFCSPVATAIVAFAIRRRFPSLSCDMALAPDRPDLDNLITSCG